MNNLDLFFKLYNELDNTLRMYYQEDNRGHSVMMRYINDLEKTNLTKFINYGKKLDDIRIIRNELVHELDMNVNQFIEITDENIKFLSMMIELVSKPKRARNIMVPLKDIFYLKDTDDVEISSTMKIMRNRGFSQLPILNDKNILTGVFSPNVLFAFLADHPNQKPEVIHSLDISPYLLIENHFSETYIFIKENDLITDVIERYIEIENKNKKIAMAFVTANGNSKEPILGIIVKKDLLSSY